MGPVPLLDLSVICKLFGIEIRSPEEAFIRRTIMTLLEEHPLPERIISAPENIRIIDRHYLPLLKKEYKEIITHYRSTRTAERHSLNEVLRAHISAVRKYVKQKDTKKAANQVNDSAPRTRAPTRRSNPVSTKSRKTQTRQRLVTKKIPVESPMKRFTEKWKDPVYESSTGPNLSKNVSSGHSADVWEFPGDNDDVQITGARRVSTTDSDVSTTSTSASIQDDKIRYAQSDPATLPIQSFQNFKSGKNNQSQRMEGIEMTQTIKAFPPASKFMVKNEDDYSNTVNITEPARLSALVSEAVDRKPTDPLIKASAPMSTKIKDEEDEDLSRFQRAISISSTSSFASEKPHSAPQEHQKSTPQVIMAKPKPMNSFAPDSFSRNSKSARSMHTAAPLVYSKNQVGEHVSDEASASLDALAFGDTTMVEEPGQIVEEATPKDEQHNGQFNVSSHVPNRPRNRSAYQYHKHSSKAQSKRRNTNNNSQLTRRTQATQDELAARESSAHSRYQPLYPSTYRPNYSGPTSDSNHDGNLQQPRGHSDDRREFFPVHPHSQRFEDLNREQESQQNDYYHSHRARDRPRGSKSSGLYKQYFGESRQDYHGYQRALRR